MNRPPADRLPIHRDCTFSLFHYCDSALQLLSSLFRVFRGCDFPRFFKSSYSWVRTETWYHSVWTRTCCFKQLAIDQRGHSQICFFFSFFLILFSLNFHSHNYFELEDREFICIFPILYYIDYVHIVFLGFLRDDAISFIGEWRKVNSLQHVAFPW